MKHEAW